MLKQVDVCLRGWYNKVKYYTGGKVNEYKKTNTVMCLRICVGGRNIGVSAGEL